jgi:HEAT repeat protein
MRILATALLLFVFAAIGAAQDAAPPLDAKARQRAIRDLAKQGTTAIPSLEAYLKDPDIGVRVEAVKAIVDIGTQHSLDPLIAATRDNDPEIQVRATDGLVNFYLPGYVRTGLTASLRRIGTGIKGRFTDTNDQVIEPYITPRPEVISALGALVRGGASMDVRANAARAVGVLRGSAAIPDLLEAIRGRARDTNVIYESLVAFQKIRDKSVAPQIAFLLRDLDERVQVTAVETTGLLQNADATGTLVDLVNRSDRRRVRRAALSALAMIPDPAHRDLFLRHLSHGDEQMRAAAAEGFARLKNPADASVVEQVYGSEKKMPSRVAQAWALVMMGRQEQAEFSPLQYLVNTLNSSSYRGVALSYLIEAAREPHVLSVLHRMATGTATRAEKSGLAEVFGRSGDRSSEEVLKTLSNDGEAEVAQAALRALQTLRARLP